MKIKWIALLLYWMALIGLLGPWLISAPSTIAVILGIVIIVASVYGTSRILTPIIKAKINEAP